MDPGGESGLCLVEGLPDALSVTHAELQPEPTWDYVQRTLEAGDVTIAIEKFTISQRTIEASRAGPNTAIEVIGGIKFLAYRYNAPPILVATPAEAKTLLTDARLKALGFYHRTPGGHANDAARHACVWLAKSALIRLPA